MVAQENVALAWSLFDRYNSRQSDPAWLDKGVTAFAADSEVIDVPSGATLRGPDGYKRLILFFAEGFPNSRTELTNAFATEDQVLGRTAGVSCLAVQEWEDRQCPYLLRYDDHAGPARSSSCNGIGYVVAYQARLHAE